MAHKARFDLHSEKGRVSALSFAGAFSVINFNSSEEIVRSSFGEDSTILCQKIYQTKIYQIKNKLQFSIQSY